MKATEVTNLLVDDLKYLNDEELELTLRQVAVLAIAALRGLVGNDDVNRMILGTVKSEETIVVENDSIEH